MKKLITGSVCVLVAWLATPVLGSAFLGRNDVDDWEVAGQFGDQFGSVNALFSGLAFVGLIYAIHQQSQELKLQRTDLKLQRHELELQRDEMSATRAEIAGQVKAQRALVAATAAQIFATAGQVKIEAIKMRSEVKLAGARNDYADEIHGIGEQILDQARTLNDFQPEG